MEAQWNKRYCYTIIKGENRMDTLNNYLQKNEIQVLGLAAFKRY